MNGVSTANVGSLAKNPIGLIPIKMRMEIQQVENGFVLSEQYGSRIHVAKDVSEAVEITTKILNKSIEPVKTV